MSSHIGTVLPIMITEWNFDAGTSDPRTNQSSFVTSWTGKALQTLVSNNVFASMQYAASNSSTHLLLNSDNTSTVQLTTMSNYYQSLQTSTPTPTSTSTPTPTPTSTSTSTPTPTPTPGTGPQYSFQDGETNACAGTVHVTTLQTTTSTSSPSPNPTPGKGPQYSFEDGGTDGWAGTGHVTSLQNSTTASGQDGTHALKTVFYSSSLSDLPYISVAPATGPSSGQTLT